MGRLGLKGPKPPPFAQQEAPPLTAHAILFLGFNVLFFFVAFSLCGPSSAAGARRCRGKYVPNADATLPAGVRRCRGEYVPKEISFSH